MIPGCSGPYSTLPAGRHPATLAELYDSFVLNAPFRDRRELIYRALTLHTDLMAARFSALRLWIDGGFTTHKPWAEPEDVDVVAVVPPGELGRAMEDQALPLSTLQGVFSGSPGVMTNKLHPMGGLMDVFILPDIPAVLTPWDTTWSQVKDSSGNLVPGATKGYLEVTIR